MIIAMEEMRPVAFARSRSRPPFGAAFNWIDNRESPRHQRRHSNHLPKNERRDRRLSVFI